jgi:predicted dehydrogenase
MADIIRIGMTGLGRSGWQMHVPTLERMPGHYRIVAGCDPDEKRRQALVERFGCRQYADFDGLLRDPEVDLVVVSVPSHLHAEYAIRALRAGKHVIVEKPMARSAEEADAMLQAARESGRHLTVYQNGRYTADYLKVREVIQSGKLGRILQIRMAYHSFRRRWDWQTLVEFGGGQLNNFASHYVDKALLLLPDAEPEVFCRLERTPLWSGDAESHLKIVLQAAGGPLIDIEVSAACAYPQDFWLVMGTQGGLSGSHDKLRWKYLNPAFLPARPVRREAWDQSASSSETLPWVEESADVSTELEYCEMAYYLDLHARLSQGEPPPVSAASVRRVVAVLDACRRASPWIAEGRPSPHEASPA